MTKLPAYLLVWLGVTVFGPGGLHGLTLVKQGDPAAVIVVPDNADKVELEGVSDLVEFVEKMSGAKLAVAKASAEPDAAKSQIRVGKALAQPVEDLLNQVADSEAGFVIAVRGNALYLAGQSPLATSFACTELLERFGCRWYIPGPLGEVFPKKPSLDFDGPDVAEKPDFNPRWLRLDPVWSRRNKLGGTGVPAAHSFHNFVNPKEFEQHPDWFPLRNGQRVAGGQLCLSNPAVIQRIVERVKEQLKANPGAVGCSLGPNDGRGWCECDNCEAMDSGRIDPFAQDRDVVDRQVKMMNMVAEEVLKEYPGKKFGFYVYSNHQLPPVTVTPHKSILPVFAPINYCRIHSMFNAKCPQRNAVRKMYEGWAKFDLEMHYRGYTFNLAGLQTPFHCFHMCTDDMPWMHEHNIRGFFPESIESWSASAPLFWLAARLAWRVRQNPQTVVAEFCDGLFGPAGKTMNGYFWRMADALRDADFHTGNDTNYPDIYTESIMKSGDGDLKQAAEQAKTDREQQSVRLFRLAHDYLQAFLDMQRYQTEFEFERSKEAHDRLVKLQDELIAMDPRFLSTKASKSYLRRFWGPAAVEAFEKTTGGNELVAKFPDEWRFMLDPHDAGEWQELHAPVLTGGNWQPIKTFSASWSDQGLNYYKGIAWYKAAVDVPGRFAGRKIRLWLAAIDEAAKVWVNGKLITYEAEKREKDGSVTKEVRDTLSGSWRPLEVEVTNAIEFGKPNTFVLKLINQNLDELGTGGIMKVVMLYATKPE